MSDYYDPIHDGGAAVPEDGTLVAALDSRAYDLLAWDLETCPLPDEQLSKAKLARVDKLVASAKKSGGRWEGIQATAKQRGSDAEQDLRDYVKATHPLLNWICCASMAKVLHPSRVERLRNQGHLVATDDWGCSIATQSFTAENVHQEPAMLDRLWTHVGKQPGRTWWVTFNGKGFDCPTLLARSLAYERTPSGPASSTRTAGVTTGTST